MDQIIPAIIFLIVAIGGPMLIFYVGYTTEDYDVTKLGSHRHKWLVDVRRRPGPIGMDAMKVAIFDHVVIFSSLSEHIGGRSVFNFWADTHGGSPGLQLAPQYKYYQVNKKSLIDLQLEQGHIVLKFHGEFGDDFEFVISLEKTTGVKRFSPTSINELYAEMRRVLGSRDY